MQHGRHPGVAVFDEAPGASREAVGRLEDGDGPFETIVELARPADVLTLLQLVHRDSVVNGRRSFASYPQKENAWPD